LLADGSVTTAKASANAAATVPSTFGLTLPAGTQSSVSDASTAAVLDTNDSASHRVLLSGQATFSCGLSVFNSGESAVATVQVFDGATAVGPKGQALVNSTFCRVTVPTTALATVGAGAHTYTLRVGFSEGFVNNAKSFSVVDASLVAVDLGRA